MPERAFLCRFWTFVFLHQKQKTKGMEHQKTSYDTLPERIDYLIQEISEIKNILINRIEKREEIPKWLNKEQALKYIQKQGYKLSLSKLYKLSATDNIPCHRSGRNLYFFAEELDKWLNNQIEEEGKTSQNLSTQSIQLIIKSAQQR